MNNCPLCHPVGEMPVWQDKLCRVIIVNDPTYPGFCRVVWAAHAAEMTDLTPHQQRHFLNVVLATEQVLRQIMQPDKINLASLGNMVPHLHWHVIPRFRDDAHFPDAIWAAVRREGSKRPAPSASQIADHLESILNDNQGPKDPV